MSAATIRPAGADDAAAVAAIWAVGWREAHDGRVPAELVAARTSESFRTRAAARVADTIVAVIDSAPDGGVAGFVMLTGDEVEQVYVAAAHRGTGVAEALLTAAERALSAAGHRRAWLAVVPGNARARRFYERLGWTDDGLFEHRAPVAGGTVAVPCHRYVKRL